MEWMEGMGPLLKVAFAIISVLVLMFIGRLLFRKEPTK
jgi:hypothetical protein